MKKIFFVFLLLFTYNVCAAPPQKPNLKLTPGGVDVDSTVKKICTPGYTKKIRNVTAEENRQVFAEYGIDPKSDHFEIDHLISLELGGSNDIKNLWPQSYTTSPYNAHLKDHLEDTLHSLVCKGKIDLSTAQKEISTDWVAAYEKYIRH
jgi:hypothetical protein